MGSRSKTKDTVEAIVPRDREGRLLPELRYVLIISRVIIIINSSLSVHTYAPPEGEYTRRAPAIKHKAGESDTNVGDDACNNTLPKWIAMRHGFDRWVNAPLSAKA